MAGHHEVLGGADVEAGSACASAARAPHPSFTACVAMLALLEVSTPLLNLVVFPLYDQTFSAARDISVLAMAVLLMGVALVATAAPRLLMTKRMSQMSLGCLVAGPLLLLPALAWRVPVLLVVASIVLAVGRGWVTVAVGTAVSRLPRRDIALCVTGAFAAAYTVAAIAWRLPAAVGLTAFFIGPLAALAIARPAARAAFEATEHDEAPRDFSVTQPATFLPLTSRLFVSMLVFKLVFGYALRFDVNDANPVADWLVALAAVVAVLVRAAWPASRRAGDAQPVRVLGQRPWDAFVSMVVLVVTAGLLCSMLPLPAAPGVSTSLLTAGSVLFELVSWTVLVTLASRNPRAAVASFSWGRGAACLGSVAGAFCGARAGALFGVDQVSVILVSAGFVLALMVYALFCLRGFSFDETIGGVVPVVEEAPLEDAGAAGGLPAVPPTSIDERCAAVAETHGLTPREREVFLMLAHGRNREYIEGHLSISRNTVKAHVKHIYAKLDVHSHQELLDLVE